MVIPYLGPEAQDKYLLVRGCAPNLKQEGPGAPGPIGNGLMAAVLFATQINLRCSYLLKQITSST